MNSQHRKHEKIARANLGEWGRSELALMGAPCLVLQDCAATIRTIIGSKYQVAYIDASHEAKQDVAPTFSLNLKKMQRGEILEIAGEWNKYERYLLLQKADLILLNGNHFTAKQQIIIIDERKPLTAKLEQLTDVRLVLMTEDHVKPPAYLTPYLEHATILSIKNERGIGLAIENIMLANIAHLNGLVLAGGKSIRMGTDKGLLHYNGKSQRDYVASLVTKGCKEVFISCNAEQAKDIEMLKIEDRFLGIGPMAGLLSAFQSNPNAAWLSIAIDLPFLSQNTIDFLIAHRNPSKVATAFINEEGVFPEPMLTIWEPRAYLLLMQALASGCTCPRKVLMDADIQLLEAPDYAALQNINEPDAYHKAIHELQQGKPFSEFSSNFL